MSGCWSLPPYWLSSPAANLTFSLEVEGSEMGHETFRERLWHKLCPSDTGAKRKAGSLGSTAGMHCAVPRLPPLPGLWQPCSLWHPGCSTSRDEMLSGGRGHTSALIWRTSTDNFEKVCSLGEQWSNTAFREQPPTQWVVIQKAPLSHRAASNSGRWSTSPLWQEQHESLLP